MKNVFYVYNLNSIGGIESWLYYISKKYGNDYDINIFYSVADERQLDRLKKYAKVYYYFGQEIECENAFFCYDISIIDKVKAKNYIQFVHSNINEINKNIVWNMHPKIDRIISVSNEVKKGFKKKTGLDSEVIYNPIIIDDDRPMLKLISCTRLSPEKGRENMIKFARALKRENIPFIWDVFTDNDDEIKMEEFVYHKPTLEISKYIKNADYLFQGSNTEAFCYSVVESLMLNIPIIAMDIPIYHELNIKDGEHGFLISKNFKNLDVQKIYESKGKLKFNYSPPDSDFEKLLAKGKRKENKNYKVKATQTFKDVVERKRRVKGAEFFVTKERYEFLNYKKAVKLIKIGKEKNE